MLYLPKTLTRILLILLCGLIAFHICFVVSKTYELDVSWLNVTRLSELEYSNILNSIRSAKYFEEVLKNREVKHIFNLPSNFIYLIYMGYLIIASIIILSAKYSINVIENEDD